MIASAGPRDAARQAGLILHALRRGTRARLDSELRRAGTGNEPGCRGSSEAERWELLEGIAEKMRGALLGPVHFEDHGPDCLVVCVELLEHLAGVPFAAAAEVPGGPYECLARSFDDQECLPGSHAHHPATKLQSAVDKAVHHSLDGVV